MKDDLQFYPTPAALALRAWQMLGIGDRDSNGIPRAARILEPSAGEGHLIRALLEGNEDARGRERFPLRHLKVDAIEFDVSKHAALKKSMQYGYELSLGKIVGMDFLAFQEIAFYTHIIMNPPFAYGVQHVLHAWHGLFAGEIVAILNAETINNPYSRERKELVALIEDHGRVEFVGRAFQRDENPDTLREADVDVVLVYLKKKSGAATAADATLDAAMSQMERERTGAANFETDDKTLCIPKSAVETAVDLYDLAVKQAKSSALAQDMAARAARRLNQHMRSIASGSAYMQNTDKPKDDEDRDILSGWANTCAELRETAWRGILGATMVEGKLSHAAKQRLQARFADVSAMSFTVSNIYGFLQGLSESAWEMQLEMMCDLFDSWSRYDSSNVVHYMGWKSNDKHRTAARRLKYTRFVMPGFNYCDYSSYRISNMESLHDYDRVFCILDGKANLDAPDLIRGTLRSHITLSNLVDGSRISTRYFDLRYYKGRGTVHMFPNRRDLVDRLNRLVGAHRKWLPENPAQASEAFWQQYEDAEKYSEDLEKAFGALSKANGHYHVRLSHARLDSRSDSAEQAQESLYQALEKVLTQRGIDVSTLMLENTPQPKAQAQSDVAPLALEAPSQAAAQPEATEKASIQFDLVLED